MNKPFITGEWIHEKDWRIINTDFISDISRETRYHVGFHVYRTKSSAKKYGNPRKVLIDNIVACGKEENDDDVIVAEKIFILEEL